jgi:hypothetical protein
MNSNFGFAAHYLGVKTFSWMGVGVEEYELGLP